MIEIPPGFRKRRKLSRIKFSEEERGDGVSEEGRRLLLSEKDRRVRRYLDLQAARGTVDLEGIPGSAHHAAAAADIDTAVAGAVGGRAGGGGGRGGAGRGVGRVGGRAGGRQVVEDGVA